MVFVLNSIHWSIRSINLKLFHSIHSFRILFFLNGRLNPLSSFRCCHFRLFDRLLSLSLSPYRQMFNIVCVYVSNVCCESECELDPFLPLLFFKLVLLPVFETILTFYYYIILSKIHIFYPNAHKMLHSLQSDRYSAIASVCADLMHWWSGSNSEKIGKRNSQKHNGENMHERI